MRKSITVFIENPTEFKLKLIGYFSKFEVFSILDRNNFNQIPDLILEYDFIAALDKITDFENINFETLNYQFNKLNDWLFGYLSYDMKNKVENLSSMNFDGIKAPEMFFFQPRFVLFLQNDELTVEYLIHKNSDQDAFELVNAINKYELTFIKNVHKIIINQRISKNEYINTIGKIKKNIYLGDIYELNYCMEFYAENVKIDATELYNKICSISPTPFSCYFKKNEINIISASPERFLKKEENKITSQPIKGTIRRGKTPEEDKKLALKLKNDPKERAENIMIVDLVRNDLAKTASFGSVKVDELCTIRSFSQVHQMISSISCQIDSKKNGFETLKNCFPMGSMTGAPKIKAMQLIEKYEQTKRGIYSGSVGYIKPNSDFDFTVIIRTILYNSSEKYLSFMVGSAITHLSEAENEYAECLLKAKAMLNAIQ